MKRVDFVILNFNRAKETIACLRSIKKIKIQDCNLKILLIDNGSTDNSVKIIQKEFPKLPIIKNQKNPGFAAGVNMGIKKVLKEKTDYVFLLNNDTLINQRALVYLIKVIGEGLKIGIVSPTLKFKKQGKIFYDFGGEINWFLGRTSHQELTTQEFKKIRREKIFPEYVSGCAMLIRKEVFDKIGFFDEDFFLYFEDVDFCLRAKAAGFKIVLVPKAIIFHKLSKSLDEKLKKKFNFKSNLIFIKKHIPFYIKPVAYLYQVLRWKFLQLF